MQNELSNYLTVHLSGKQLHLPFSEICYMKGQGAYTEVRTAGARYIVCIGLAKLEKQCAIFGFQRIHRSFLVNLDRIDQFNTKKLYINGQWLPISSGHKEALLQKLKPFLRW